MLRTREEGTFEDRWQQEEVLGSSISSTAPVPGGVASGQLVRTFAMQFLAPFIRQEVLNRHPVPSNFFESHMVGSQLGFLSEVDPGQGF